MVVVNMTKDRFWVRDGVVSKFPNMSPPQFDMALYGGLIVPAPPNRRQDVQQQSIRDAEIPPEQYYPKGYQPRRRRSGRRTSPSFSRRTTCPSR